MLDLQTSTENSSSTGAHFNPQRPLIEGSLWQRWHQLYDRQFLNTHRILPWLRALNSLAGTVNFRSSTKPPSRGAIMRQFNCLQE